MPLTVTGSQPTSYDWVEYFYQNAPEPVLPWIDARRLSGAERRAVTASIQQFQLGENASGDRLIERAQRFARRSGDLGFVAALRLFIREEQRHSRILAQFLRREGLPCLRRHWIHEVFRKVRGLAGVELCLKVLATAEVIARPYYSALRDATGSPLLQQICELILKEESAHLRFQSLALQKFRICRIGIAERAVKVLHRSFLLCTAMVVWMGHLPVFRAAGRSFPQFWAQALEEFEAMYRADKKSPGECNSGAQSIACSG